MPNEHKADPNPQQASHPYTLLGPSGDVLDDVSAESRLTRLQALLAQWLRMENLVVLLGAGGSTSHGGALMGGLEDFVLAAAKGACTCDKELQPCIPVLEKRLHDRTASSAPSFERWLTFLATAQYVAQDPNTPVASVSLKGHTPNNEAPVTVNASASVLAKFIKLLGQIIFIRCSLKLPEVAGGSTATGHHALMAKLVARDPSLGRAHIFTTNYDTLVEQALDDLGILCCDGFTGTVEPRFDPSSYGLDVYYPGEVAEGRVRRFDKFVHFYKTHGSVHWRRRSDGKVIQVRDPRLAAWEAWSTKPPAEQLKYLESVFSADGDVIGILPTENKFVQTLGMPYAHLFRAFHQRLQAPQTFFLVIGYSFGDEHLNAIINDAMTNPSLVMVVVDPFGKGQIEKCVSAYQATGERAFLLCGDNPKGNTPKNATFDHFAHDLMPHVQWIDDFTRIRKAERIIMDMGVSNTRSEGTGDAQ